VKLHKQNGNKDIVAARRLKWVIGKILE